MTTATGDATPAGWGMPGPAGPLAHWRFTGTLRRSQRVVLGADSVRESMAAGEPVHVVAPPGSGKTLLGLLLAVERGDRTLVLSPTGTIRRQWARTATSLAAGTWAADAPADPEAVSEDPHAPADLTSLTYQMLSVTDRHHPFEDLGLERWVDELVDGGRTEADARAWLDALHASNRSAHRRGLRRRARSIRKTLLREDPARIERVLHPNALELVDRLVAHGVATIVLDECHHLLDHWALVVGYLTTRLRAAGIEPQLIGLTATLPSTEDENEYDNYTGLLGDVDYELPTPAVVKEGNLSPYRSLAWFVTPSGGELEFLRTHETRLAGLVRELLETADGEDFLTALLQPPGQPYESADDPDQRLAVAFHDDPALAEGAARMLLQVAPAHPLRRRLGPDLAGPPTADQRIRLLARYALDRILPDPRRAEQWEHIRAVLVDFGYTLTDRGVRRGRDPIDTLLATSSAKDHAVAEILRLEQARDGERIRAVVTCDYAVHGHALGTGTERAGALRCFAVVAADPSLADLRGILVTSQHLRIAARDAPTLLPALTAALDLDAPLAGEPVEGQPHVRAVPTPGAGSARVLAAVSALMKDGVTRLIVGTRGLLGEGWDCPSVNTLIDLTAVTTSSSTQQLRGRTLRLDPGWPEKVAHNWSVAAVLDPAVRLDGEADVDRLRRKVGTVWGLSLDDGATADAPPIIRGIGHTLTPDQLRDLDRLLARERGSSAAGLNAAIVESLPSRSATRSRWGIGEEYLGVSSEAVLVRRQGRIAPFLSGLRVDALLAVAAGLVVAAAVESLTAVARGGALSVGALLVTFALVLGAFAWLGRSLFRDLWRAIRAGALPATAYRGAALALAAGLTSRGELPPIGRANIRVTAVPPGARPPERYQVEVLAGTPAERGLLLGTLTELFAPITSPRFVLEVGAADLRWSSVPTWVCMQFARLLGHRSRYFAVPRIIGRRRADAHAFADRWASEVGPCRLHEISGPEDMAMLTRARRQSAGRSARPVRRHAWS